MNPHIARVAKYAIVGALNTLLYSGLLLFFLDGLKFSAFSSVTISYLLAMGFHFAANRKITFRSSENISRQFIRYFVSAFVSYIASLFIVTMSRDYLGFSAGVTVAISALAIALVGYLLGHYWVYR